MKTILNPHKPTIIDYLPESPTSTCANCEKTIEQFTWYDDDCGWRTDKNWHFSTWHEGTSPNVRFARFHYECEPTHTN
jgi:hypothetical protein